MSTHPIANVEWVDREELTANSWNPNAQTSAERELLALSILATGWTQPIVVRPDGEIVDGYHRWLVSADPRFEGAAVPVVRVDVDESEARLATVRHNRARGRHGVLRMGDLVTELTGPLGMPPADVAAKLGMETEEVIRLADTRGVAAIHADPDGALSEAQVWEQT